MNKVIIIGGGAAGMMAGIMLAEKGYQPVIYEKNDKLGRKLFITGKGRCNLTNNCSKEELFQNIVSNSKFMYSSIYGFDSEDAMRFFENLGLKLKTERGGRVFPASDHSSDVIGAMTTRLHRLGVEVHLNTEVLGLLTEDIDMNDSGENGLGENPGAKVNKKANPGKRITGITVCDKDKKEHNVECDDVIIATGGVSYPLTGSTGDGIRWAKELGLAITEPRPALVPVVIREKFCGDLMGLSLKNVRATFIAVHKKKDKEIYSDFGEMLFTHYGVSGPIILSASSYIGKYLDANLRLRLDLKPALSEEQLDDRILRDFAANINRQFRNSLDELLPKRLIPVIIEQTGIDPYKKVNEVSKTERQTLVKALKTFELHVDGLRDFNEAIITQGGVSVKEINPGDMTCKRVEGLRFIGEVIDVDALTGGFNLQVAWSTAAALV